MTSDKPHQNQPLKMSGAPLGEATAAVIMLHGRGADAQDILSLSNELAAPHVIFLAPEAADHTWYPHSFLAPLVQNEPYLSSALEVIGEIFNRLHEAGISASQTMILGFSQGACLGLEFAAHHAQRFGGLAGLSGGLIGPEGTPRDYAGSLAGTPVFLGCCDRDPHVPAQRVLETEQVMMQLGAHVTRRLYPKMGHTINRDELAEVQKMLSAMIAQKASL